MDSQLAERSRRQMQQLLRLSECVQTNLPVIELIRTIVIRLRIVDAFHQIEIVARICQHVALMKSHPMTGYKHDKPEKRNYSPK
jgi:hypothetical protein